MKRRTFFHAAGGTLVAAACAARHGSLRGAIELPMQSPMRIAVYDPTLARGQALARAAARMGVPALPLGAKRGDDIGMLWHAQLARRLESRTEAPLGAPCALCALCTLRASDRFVLERLATPHRCIVLDVSQT